MTRKVSIFLWLGAALLATLFMFSFVQLGDVGGPPVAPGAAQVQIIVATRTENPVRGVDEEQETHATLDLSYPTELNENQTSIVSLRVDGFQEQVLIDRASDQEVSRERMNRELTFDTNSALELISTGFDIGPAGPISKPAGTRLPAEFSWTISPRSYGDHQLLLDLSGFVSPLQPNQRLTSNFSVNGLAADLSDTRVARLKISVLTEWGVTGMTLAIGRSLVAVLAFILAYPVVSEWIKRRALRSS